MHDVARGARGGVRGVVFDLDGTLVDSYEAIGASVNAARETFGLPPLLADDVRRRVGRGLESLMEDVVGRERAAEGVAVFRARYAEIFPALTSALPGAVETLRELRRRGYRLAVASNKPARFGEPILERLGMRGFLDAVEGPDTAGSTKPHPAMIERCLREMGVASSETIYVGDMVLDVETGERAGIDVVLVGGGSSSLDDLRATGRAVLRSIVDLLDRLPGVPSPRTVPGDFGRIGGSP
jgi:2-phosphoglycolate phosphatase